MCSRTGHWEKALPWKLNTRDTDGCFVLGCGPCHPQAWISDKECFKLWGGVGIRFVALFPLSQCTLRGYSGTGGSCMQSSPSMLRWHWIAFVCVCVCFISSQRLYPTKPWPGVSYMYGNALCKLAAKPGLVQVLCICVREKQVDSGLDGLTEIYFHLWRAWPVGMRLPFVLLFLPSHSALSSSLPSVPSLFALASLPSAYSEEGLDNKICSCHVWQSAFIWALWNAVAVFAEALWSIAYQNLIELKEMYSMEQETVELLNILPLIKQSTTL